MAVEGVVPELFENIPVGADQTAPVAEPPKLPSSPIEVEPCCIEGIGRPAETVGGPCKVTGTNVLVLSIPNEFWLT